MTKRLLKSSVIIVIIAMLALFWVLFFAFSIENAYADEPDLPTTEWAASFSLGGSGSPVSPYIIAIPQDLTYVANEVEAGNSFENKYFSLINDLDMSGYLAKPIGSYTGFKPFNGIFEGNGYTISGVAINRSSDNTAIFGYLGSNGKVSNFTISEGSIIIGQRYTASAIGRCAGTVEGILSFADVRGTSPVGGIVGNNYQGTVNNCVFAGSITTTASGYGIEGMNNNGGGSGSWYLTNNFSYIHNARGNILYVGGNGSVSADIVSGDPTFTLYPDGDFLNEVRTADETVVCTDTEYVPDSNLNDAMYFARFVKNVTIAPVSKGTVSGAGTYYEGQNVKIKVKANEGYYFNTIVGNITPAGASYSNDIDNSVVYSFPMSTASLEFSVTLGTFEPVEGSIITEFTYDGEQKIVTDEATLQGSGSAYQDFNFNISYISPTQGTLPTPPIKAGSYSAVVTISKHINSAPIIIGRVEYPFTIGKAQLEIIDSSEFPASKQYDNVATITLPVQDNFTVVGNDKVNMTASVTYYTDYLMETIAFARGEGYYAVYIFSISGEDSSNYLPPDNVIISNASIVRRIALVSIEERFLSKVYNELPPSIQAYSVDSVGVIDIEFIFTHLAGANEGDIGLYSIGVQFKTDIYNPNNDNHTLELEEEYTFEITPMKVTVTFSGYTNLAYTGAEQSITALHGTVYAGIFEAAGITYKMDDAIVPLLNAGDYIAYAYSLNSNYELIGTTTCEFNVSKIDQTDDLCIDQVEDTTYNIQPILLTTTGGDGDGTVTYTLISGKATINEDVLTLYGAGEIKIQATKAESQNYFQITSGIMSFYVSKANLTVFVTNIENYITYNDILELPITYSGFVAGEEDFLIPTGLVKPTIKLADNIYTYNTNVRLNASEIGYPITLSGGASDGYEIIADNSAEPLLFVAKKALTVRANQLQKIYGQSDPVLSYTIDEGTFALSGTLARESGNDVGEYNISPNTLTDTNNPNFIITFYPNIFTITKAGLTIRPNSTQKAYGEQDPSVTYQVVGLVYTDTIQIEIGRAEGESPGFYLYTLADITVSENYSITFNDFGRGLTINKILPVIDVKPVAATIIYGTELTGSTFSGGTVKAVTNEGDMTVTGVYLWDSQESIFPNISDSNVTEYSVRFIPNDEVNYSQVTFDISITILPLEFSVEYEGESELIYSGKPQKQVLASPIGVLAGDNINFSFSYSGDMVNAGIYQVIPAFDNPNYKLAQDSEYEVRIVKKSLNIKLENAEYNDNKVPAPIFNYLGFVEDESESVLNALPKADMPNTAGTYQIAPYGAVADNYQIVYNKGTVIVRQSILYTKEESITAIGSYDADISLEADIIPKSGQGKFNSFEADFKTFKQGRYNLNGLSVKIGYNFSFMRNGNEAQPEQPVTIRILIPDNIAHARSFEVLYYNEAGDIEIVEGATLDGNYLVLVTDQMGDYMIVTNNDYTIFVIIFVIVALFGLFMLLDIGVKARRRRIKVGSEYQKRYNHAYRQAKREKKTAQKLAKAKTREEHARGKQFKYVSRDDIY